MYNYRSEIKSFIILYVSLVDIGFRIYFNGPILFAKFVNSVIVMVILLFIVVNIRPESKD